MELQPDDPISHQDRLFITRLAAREVLGAGWEGKGIAMPVKGLERLGECRERSRSLHKMHGPPPDFPLPVARHFAAEHIGHQLRAEAHAEERLPRIQRVADELLLQHQPRMLLVLVNVHRPPHYDEQVKSLQRWWELAFIEKDPL